MAGPLPPHVGLEHAPRQLGAQLFEAAGLSGDEAQQFDRVAEVLLGAIIQRVAQFCQALNGGDRFVLHVDQLYQFNVRVHAVEHI